MTATQLADDMPFAPPLGASRRLRLLMTVDAVGGVWRYAMELALALRGHDVETVFAVLGPRPAPRQVAEAAELGAVAELAAPLDWMAGERRELEPVAGAVQRAAAEHEADIVQLNIPSQAAGLDVEMPVIAVCHSCVATWWQAVRGSPLPKQWRWQAELTAAGLARADAVVAPSAGHAMAVARCYAGQASAVVVHNATRREPLPLAKKPFVLAAGRWWDEGKNGAALDLAARDCGWPVVMAGAAHGPNGQRLDIRHASGCGELPSAELLALMADAAIFVSPSLYEPFGLAPLEAARSRCALVLADIPVFRELWEGAALFFEPRDPSALAAAVNRLAADEELRLGLGAMACLRSLMFTPEAQAAAMRGIYDDALAGAKAGMERA